MRAGRERRQRLKVDEQNNTNYISCMHGTDAAVSLGRGSQTICGGLCPLLVHCWLRAGKYLISPNSICLVTSRLDTTRHVRRVELVHFGCVERVE